MHVSVLWKGFCLQGILLLFTLPLYAENKDVLLVRDQSFLGNYLAESPDREWSKQLVDFGEELRKKATLILSLEPISPFKTLIRIVPKMDPGEGVRFRPVISEGKLDFYLEVGQPINIELLKKEIVRSLIYEKILPSSQEWKGGMNLPPIPLWLNVGVLQKMIGDPDHILEKIIRRQVSLKKIPLLSQILNVMQLSTLEIESEYQKAFFYAAYLWFFNRDDSATEIWSKVKEGVPIDVSDSSQEVQLKWERYLSDFRTENKLLLSWDETQRATSNLLYFALEEAVQKEEKTVFVSWDQLRSVDRHPQLVYALQKRSLELIELEAQAHFAWRAFLWDYRTALNFLTTEILQKNQKSKQSNAFPQRHQLKSVQSQWTYESAISEAKKELEAVQRKSSEIQSYLDWFEVNHQNSERPFMFERYYQKVERFLNQKPNPSDPYQPSSIRIEVKE